MKHTFDHYADLLFNKNDNHIKIKPTSLIHSDYSFPLITPISLEAVDGNAYCLYKFYNNFGIVNPKEGLIRKKLRHGDLIRTIRSDMETKYHQLIDLKRLTPVEFSRLKEFILEDGYDLALIELGDIELQIEKAA